MTYAQWHMMCSYVYVCLLPEIRWTLKKMCSTGCSVNIVYIFFLGKGNYPSSLIEMFEVQESWRKWDLLKCHRFMHSLFFWYKQVTGTFKTKQKKKKWENKLQFLIRWYLLLHSRDFGLDISEKTGQWFRKVQDKPIFCILNFPLIRNNEKVNTWYGDVKWLWY